MIRGWGLEVPKAAVSPAHCPNIPDEKKEKILNYIFKKYAVPLVLGVPVAIFESDFLFV